VARILVTGGAGFQGSHLSEALLAMGHHVTVLNTLSVAAKRNLRIFEANELADIVFGSVTDWELISKTVRDHDVVFHLAANVNVDKSLDDPRSFLETSLGPDALLDETAELRPNSPYAASKAAADRLCYSYFRSYGMDISIVRPFNIFGERQKSGAFGALIAILVRRAIAGHDLTVFGDGSATRDYLHVSDAVDAYRLVLETPDLQGRAINFASGTNTRVRDIAEYIAAKFGTRVVNGPARPGEVTRFPASVALAQSIGFSPKVGLWAGIDRYIEWAKEQPLQLAG
jgi:nucleoside-diphosphate-sugar epimerase